MLDEKLLKPYDSKKVWKMCLTGSLGSFVFGYNNGVMNSTLDVVGWFHGWEDEETLIAVMTGIMPLGAMISAVLAGPISNRIGIRKALMASNLMTLVGAGVTIIPFAFAFGLGRFLSGLSVGMYATLVPLYINQTSPSEIMGKVGTLVQIQITLGTAVAYALALVLPTGNYGSSSLAYWWVFMFWFQAPIALFQFLVFYFVYKLETPAWFSNNSFREETLNSLRQVYRGESAQEAARELNGEYDQESTESSGSEHDPSYLDLLLFKKSTGKFMRLGYANHFFQQFSGINAILTFSTTIFGHLGGGVFMSRVCTLILGVVNMTSTLALTFVVDKFGRKTLLTVGCLGMTCCLLFSGMLAGPLSNWSILFPVCFIFLYIVFFATSTGPICWVYCGEIMNSKGMSICAGFNRLCNTVVIFTFPFLKAFWGISVVFWIYSGVCALGVAYFALNMIETKGLSKQEIQKLFTKKAIS